MALLDENIIYLFIYLFIYIFNPHLRTLFHCFYRGRLGGSGGRRERESERETDRQTDIEVSEKHQLVAISYVPWPGIELATWGCALIGNWTHDLSVYGTMLQQTELHWPGWRHFLYKKVFVYSSYKSVNCLAWPLATRTPFGDKWASAGDQHRQIIDYEWC